MQRDGCLGMCAHNRAECILEARSYQLVEQCADCSEPLIRCGVIACNRILLRRKKGNVGHNPGAALCLIEKLPSKICVRPVALCAVGEDDAFFDVAVRWQEVG